MSRKMISNRDKKTIFELARKYRAKRIFLFDSGAGRSSKAQDIDLAVEGVPDREFFEFYGELILKLSKPIDLIDLKIKNKFSRMVIKEGILLYDQAQEEN